MSERTVITSRIASNHPMPHYGGVQHPDELLERLAEAARTGAIPLILEHDHARSLNARCLHAEVVDLPDGHKAVDAEFEVDSETWKAFQHGLDAKGVPGGMSFTYGQTFAELTPDNPPSDGHLALLADASHFTDEAIEKAGTALTRVGTVRLGRLYQFDAAHSCRVVVEYVQQSGGLDAAAKNVALGVAGSAIYDALKQLLRRRSTARAADEAPPQIEIHTTSTPDGISEQRLLLRTDDEGVLKDALERFMDVTERPSDVLIWDEATGDWADP